MIILFILALRTINASAYDYTCLKGQYPIGNRMCKIEPTGCPYGDSIPLGPECDKQAPVLPETPVIVPDVDMVLTPFVGK